MEFVCPDPNATVRAANVKATLDAFKLIPRVGRELVTRHQLSLDDLTPEKFVPVQRWLDALKEIQATVGANVLRQVGAGIVENADFPPVFDSVEAVLLALDTIYYLNHRGDVGHYRPQQQEDKSVVIRCETPYPRQFELGLVEGICRNKKRAGATYVVEFADGPPNANLTCTLTVRRR